MRQKEDSCARGSRGGQGTRSAIGVSFISCGQAPFLHFRMQKFQFLVVAFLYQYRIFWQNSAALREFSIILACQQVLRALWRRGSLTGYNHINTAIEYSSWIGHCLSNPLSCKSDQHQLSPCNIDALKNRVVMRVTDMIKQNLQIQQFFVKV